MLMQVSKGVARLVRQPDWFGINRVGIHSSGALVLRKALENTPVRYIILE